MVFVDIDGVKSTDDRGAEPVTSRAQPRGWWGSSPPGLSTPDSRYRESHWAVPDAIAGMKQGFCGEVAERLTSPL